MELASALFGGGGFVPYGPGQCRPAVEGIVADPHGPTTVSVGSPEGNVFGLRDVTTEVNSRVGADVLAVLADPAVVAQLETASQLVRPGDAKEFAAALEKQRSVIGTAAANLGVKPRERAGARHMHGGRLRRACAIWWRGRGPRAIG